MSDVDRYRTKRPEVSGSIVMERNRAVCHLPHRVVEVRAPVRLLRDLVHLCDGDTSREEIIDRLAAAWDAERLDALLARLEQEGVLVDAGDIAAGLWSAVKHPQRMAGEPTPEELSAAVVQATREITETTADARYFAVPDTALNRLLEKRASTRRFSAAAVPLEKIIAALWAGYGVPRRRAVPSAGGLYPLQVHLIQLRDIAGLAAGIYRVWYHERDGVGLHCLGGDPDDACAAWLDPTILRDAQGVFVLSGDFARTAAKYGNRAALFVPLEAGHAAQNVLLSAAESGVGAVELGGFVEDRLSLLLQLSKHVVPLVTIAYGAPAGAASVTAASDASYDFRWVFTETTAYRPPFFLGAAIARSETGEWCWGMSAEPKTAYIKATAEAAERSACAAPCRLIHGALSDIPDAVFPGDIAAYTPAQYRRADFPFAPFDPDREYAWVEGEDCFSGRRACVLADFIYYGRGGSSEPAQAKPYTFANTSGVAAFPAVEGALERAVLELVERHAFMAVWLADRITPAIGLDSMPAAVHTRVRRLNEAGFSVVFKDITFDAVPVVLVVAQSVTRHITKVSTCAAYDPAEALDHALAEVEASIAVRLAADDGLAVRPKAVRSPADHGNLYAQPRYFRRADRLAAFDSARRLDERHAGAPTNWQSLSAWLAQRHLPLLVFRLGPESAEPGATGTMAVVRAIVPGLIPMSFGYGTEPLATPCITALAMPHERRRSLATRPLFPHPFA